MKSRALRMKFNDGNIIYDGLEITFIYFSPDAACDFHRILWA